MNENPKKITEEPEREVKEGKYDYQDISILIKDFDWCVNHWGELGASGQTWALSIHGAPLNNKILGY